MATSIWQSEFESLFEAFTEGLDNKDAEDLKKISFKELQTTIGDIQEEQHHLRRLQNLARLEPFLEATKQFSAVVQLFCNNNDVVTFIWAPLKLLLLVTRTEPAAFNELINAYERVGESMLMCLQYQSIFLSEPHMVKALISIYDVILEFHHILLNLFQRPQWQQLFHDTWGTCESRLFGIYSVIDRHRSLLESKASLAQVEDVRKDVQSTRQQMKAVLDKEDLHHLHIVTTWLSATDVETDQEEHAKLRAEYPGTGRWLLDNPSFKEWFDPQIVMTPPLLWLTGMPGAGKTVLASLVVEEALQLNPTPTVLYFFFKHGNGERDNFVALARSLLAQLLKQNRGSLLSLFYQKCCLSGKTVLTSLDLMQELLHLAFENCKSAYIILDGLDECTRDKQKTVTTWFKDLVEGMPASDAARIRCLFVSGDDGIAKRDFSEVVSIKIRKEDTRQDIDAYSRVEASKLKGSFDLSDKKASEIANIVVDTVQGLFLLAKLIWINLSDQTSVLGLEEELESNNLPKGIGQAYSRIMDRILQQTSEGALEDTMMLLKWLVCAKRPLKWYEIQGMKSINLEERSISFDHQRFRKTPKDLCGSLVELHPDGSVQFVHLTAKQFLIEADHVNQPPEELRMARLCVDYLNLPAFIDPPTEIGVLNGDYGFMDYAVIQWHRHLEAGLNVEHDTADEELIKDLTESLGVFIQHHWRSPSTEIVLAKRHSDKLNYFKSSAFYDKLKIVLASSKKQLRLYGSVSRGEVALDLVDIVASARKVLQHMIGSCDLHSMANIEQMYGKCLFKCSRFGCLCFTSGFCSAAELEGHENQHKRPFRCTREGCWAFSLGFASAAQRETHMKKTHPTTSAGDEDFPTEQEVRHSIENHAAAISPTHANETHNAQHQSIQEPASMEPTEPTEPEPESGPSSESAVQHVHTVKRRRQTEFICWYCSKTFNKRYNLHSHLIVHEKKEQHQCSFCSKMFSRLSDLNRHKRSHSQEKEYECGGYLKNGQKWGCGRSFARADTLAKHQESWRYRACTQPLRDEQELDNESEIESEPESEQEQEQGQDESQGLGEQN